MPETTKCFCFLLKNTESFRQNHGHVNFTAEGATHEKLILFQQAYLEMVNKKDKLSRAQKAQLQKLGIVLEVLPSSSSNNELDNAPPSEPRTTSNNVL